ncbi:hypothetical protein MmTuc01_2852 [Methanosarcina mazei Tuc01]|uniref:Uncharacterized protein n=1 Tax=Methanosarcina mazei Tuc01 TaxID=1236903 RepID=M1Q0M9_METMZ|nr:hypothetical protein MmTuc01_2852 [Methanosarcina mazei Tuc01]
MANLTSDLFSRYLSLSLNRGMAKNLDFASRGRGSGLPRAD